MLQYDRCPICHKNFQDCSHSIAEVNKHLENVHLRKIVQEEIKNNRKRKMNTHTQTKTNLDYLNEKTTGMSRARKDSIHCYLVGAASTLIEQGKWHEIVDNAVAFFDRVYSDKAGEQTCNGKS